jgi:A/G-specific adenine glycosylase
MWELPEITGPLGHWEDRSEPLFTVKHSITVTDYTVKVWPTSEGAGIPGKWWGMDRLPELPLTGLARKILRRSGIFRASGAKSTSSRMAGRASVEDRSLGGRGR